MILFKRKLNNTQKVIVIITVLMLVVSTLFGSVYAYLKWNTENVENTFIPAVDVDPTIIETFADNQKTNVAVQIGDTGYSAYVRAAIVATWVKADNKSVVHASVPIAGSDFNVILDNTNWFLGADGFYYHKKAVSSGGTTEILIESCSPVADMAPDGYVLDVKIIAQTIQAPGTADNTDIPAVEAAWKVVRINNTTKELEAK